MVKNNIIDKARLDGGILCLDFVNTVHDRVAEPLRSYVNNFTELLYWARKVAIVDKRSHTVLEKAAQHDPKKSTTFFSEAIRLRELLYHLFQVLSETEKINKDHLEKFNHLLTRYFPFLQLTYKDGFFQEYWNVAPESFLIITAPIIKSAHGLLLSENLKRIKECPNCGWLFLDSTKNGKRRWCSMQTCGSSVKSLDYYYRNKKKKRSTD